MLKKAILPTLLLTTLCLTPFISEARRRPQSKPTTTSQNVPGKFDFYVLTLSWSPDYCETAGSRDPNQCSKGKQLGFVLHGLWPQYNSGWPANCTTEAFDPKIKKQFPNLYPSPKLYTHEWEKHGTCSGLSQTKYHQLAFDLKNGVKIPDRYIKPTQPFRTTIGDLKQDFIRANPAMTENSIAPTCSGSGRFLKEVMVCHSKNGQPGECSTQLLKNSQKSCGQPNFLVRSVR